MAFPPFVRWHIVGCCAFVDGAACNGEPPWESIDAYAFDADGRAYALEVSTRERFDRLVADDPDAVVPDVVDVVVPGHASLRVTVGWEQPHVVVDAPTFGRAIVDALVDAPADVRVLVFAPGLTEAEQAWFDERDEAIEREQVPAAELALTLVFGASWRIEAGDAAVAAAVLVESGFAIEPTPLFLHHPDRWSNRARTIIRQILAAQRPD